MLDDWTILCLANYVYTYSHIYTRTMTFSIDLLLAFIRSSTSNPKSAPMSSCSL